MAKVKQKKPGRVGRGGAGKTAAGRLLETATAAPVAESLHVTQVVDGDPSAPDLTKRQLIEQVVARSGAKPREVKPLVEAMLAVLGEAVAEGRGLTLEPLGKLRITRQVDKSDRRVTIARLRQSKGSASVPTVDEIVEDS
ncbi:HU family DNA-binding protein [Pseudodonghicola flavimaris]|uniref:HU family DNA-binding protein n=1 Tax=Pseudodonghicola flavimaris TaxID=3050036 RepID=A0ABT7F530_9RHOB|nr:HU family DNA-binding protein [Pseudodonghicola flavimaris]MDK3019710.1 HU family DNA-binding protein [Pseudodonghicola flavimaris]